MRFWYYMMLAGGWTNLIACFIWFGLCIQLATSGSMDAYTSFAVSVAHMLLAAICFFMAGEMDE